MLDTSLFSSELGFKLSLKDSAVQAERQSKLHQMRVNRNEDLITIIEKNSAKSGIKEKLRLEIQLMSHELDTVVTTNNAKSVVKNALSAGYRAVESAELADSFEKYEAVIIGRGYKKGDFDAEGLPNDPVRQFIQA